MPTIGQDCTIILQNPNVNLGQPVGFFIRPDSLRVLLPKVWYRGTNVNTLIPTTPLAAGKRVIELVVLCRNNLLNADGTPASRTAEQYHNLILAFGARVNESMTLTDVAGQSYTVGCEELEDRWSPLGGRFLKEWETRCVFVEV